MVNFDDMKQDAQNLKSSAKEKLDDMKHTGDSNQDDTGQKDTSMMDSKDTTMRTSM